MTTTAERRRGIYRIRNLQDGQTYVGLSEHLAQRFKTHQSALNAGRHASGALQADWTTLGAQAFVFEVLEEVPPGQWLEPRERHYFRTLQPAYNTLLTPEETFVPLTGYVPRWMKEYVKRLGEGHLTEGLRRVIREHEAAQPYSPPG